MSIPYLIFKRKYSSTEAGGGVPGKDIGIVPTTMTEGGVITGERQPFTDIFIMVGEMISGVTCGEDNRGNMSEYPISIFITIGAIGKEPDTGIR